MKLIAQTPILHNGKRFEPGEGFEADRKAGAALVANGDAVEADKAAKPEGEPQ